MRPPVTSFLKKLHTVTKSHMCDFMCVKCPKLDFGFWGRGGRKWDFTVIDCKFPLAVTNTFWTRGYGYSHGCTKSLVTRLSLWKTGFYGLSYISVFKKWPTGTSECWAHFLSLEYREYKPLFTNRAVSCRLFSPLVLGCQFSNVKIRVPLPTGCLTVRYGHVAQVLSSSMVDTP